MKKFVTLLLVAILAVSCVVALTACDKYSDEVLEDTEHGYQITGQWNGWGLNFDEEDSSKLDAKYAMTAVALTNEVLKPIRKDLRDSNGGAKFVYIVECEFDFVDLLEFGDDLDAAKAASSAGWVNNQEDAGTLIAPTEGAEARYFDGNSCIKLLRATFNEEVQDWTVDSWLPSPEAQAFRSLTPDTLYIPPYSAEETYENSGTWANNPSLLKAGTYYIVFAAFNDGTYGLGAIAK